MRKATFLLTVIIFLSCKKEQRKEHRQEDNLVYDTVTYIDSINTDSFITLKDGTFSNELDYTVFNNKKVSKITNEQLSKLGASSFSKEDSFKKYYYGTKKIANWNVHLISEEETIVFDNKRDSVQDIKLAYLLFEKNNKFKYVLKVAATKIEPESIIYSTIKVNYIITEEQIVSYDAQASAHNSYFQVIEVNDNSIKLLNKVEGTKVFKDLMNKKIN